MRVVSLLPGLTESVYALGEGARLVGRSHECDHPPQARTLPVCTAPRFETGGSSRAVDARVRELVERGLSVYHVDAERLRALRPDVILTQDACAVCAASRRDVEAALRAWTGTSPRLVSLAPTTLGDVVDDLRRVGEALDVAARGRALAEALGRELAEVGERAGRLGPRPRVACIEWIEPLMAAGNWMPELVRLAGGTPLLGESGAHSAQVPWDRLRDAEPEVIVVVPCGFDVARTRRELPRLEALPGWSGTPAARAGRVYLADGNAWFNRPGPRIVEALAILAEMVHPAHFDAGWRGRAFEPAA